MGFSVPTLASTLRHTLRAWVMPLWLFAGIALPIQHATAEARLSRQVIQGKKQSERKQESILRQADPAVAHTAQAPALPDPLALPLASLVLTPPAAQNDVLPQARSQGLHNEAGFYIRYRHRSIAPNAP